MKKTVSLMLCFLLAAALLTGCMQSDIGVSLKEDGTGTVSVSVELEESLYAKLKESGTDPFVSLDRTPLEKDGVRYIKGEKVTECSSYKEIEETLLGLTCDPSLFNVLETETETDTGSGNGTETGAENENGEVPESEAAEMPAAEAAAASAPVPLFRSVEIRKEGRVIHTVYSFRAVLNPVMTQEGKEIPPLRLTVELPEKITESRNGETEGNRIGFDLSSFPEETELSAVSEATDWVSIAAAAAACAVLVTAALIIFRKKG